MIRRNALIFCLVAALFCLVALTAAADGGILTLPSDLTVIEEEAFRGVVSADKVIVPEGVTAIGAGTFEDGRFSEILLPSTVTEIGAGAFRNCGKPTDPVRFYVIPDGIDFGEEAFDNCRADIYINGSLLPYYEYTLTEDSAAITGMYGFASLQDAVVPGTIEGKPVSSIKSTLTWAVLPKTVTAIRNYAFDGCGQLASVELPAGLTAIGSCSFRNTGLTAVTIPEGVTSIGSSAFESDQQLVAAVLPEGLESIGEKAFNDCYVLEQVSIPSTVTEIGKSAFRYNKALRAVTIPAGIASLPADVFVGCEQLESVQLPDGLTELGEYTFSRCTKLASVNLPGGLTAIGKSCFENACRTYTGNPVYELPESLVTVGSNAFYNCGAGLAVVRGGGVEVLMKEYGYEFTYQDGNEFRYKYFSTSSGDETVWTLKLTGYKGEGGEVVIPAGPAAIAERAMLDKDTVTSVVIPDGVVTIERWAFEQCDGLTEAVMPDTVTTVLSGAFKSCPKLTDVTFSANLTKLDGDVFQKSCKGQEGVHYYDLPDGLAEFDRYTFDSCEAVLCVRSGTDAETQIRNNNYIFTYSDPDRKDFRYRQDGQKLTLWAYAGSSSPVILPDDCEAVRYAGFSSLQAGGLVCTQMSDTAAALSAAELNFTFPGHEDIRYRVIDGVLYIMGYAGTDTAVTIPKAAAYVQAGVDEQIRQEAFRNNTAITKVVIPEGVTRINGRAFYGCTLLTDITLPQTLKSMDNSVFYHCGTDSSAVKPIRLVLPDTMENVNGRGGGDCTFLGFNAVLICGLESQTAALLTDRNYVFTAPGQEDFRYRYESFTEGEGEAAVTYRRLWLAGYAGTDTEVTIPGGIYGIKRYITDPSSDYACTFHAWGFCGNEAVTSVVIPEGTEEIGSYAFSGCVNLTDISFPDSLKILGSESFRECGSNAEELHYYRLPDHMTQINTNTGAGWGAFAGINKGRISCTPGTDTAILVTNVLDNYYNGGYLFAIRGHETDGMLYRYEARTNTNGETEYKLILMQYEGTGSEAVIPAGCGIYGISKNVFRDHTELEKVVIPEGIVEIGDNVFSGCTMLHQNGTEEVNAVLCPVIRLPATLTKAGNSAFSNMGSECGKRFYMVLPASLTEFDINIFAGCEAVLIAPPDSIAAGRLYDAWYYYYSTLEDAVMHTNCMYKRYYVDGEEQEHIHYGNR